MVPHPLQHDEERVVLLLVLVRLPYYKTSGWKFWKYRRNEYVHRSRTRLTRGIRYPVALAGRWSGGFCTFILQAVIPSACSSLSGVLA